MRAVYDKIKDGSLTVVFKGCKPSPLEHRFWANVDKVGSVHPQHGQCWCWKGDTDTDGYGVVTDRRRVFKAHRYSWELTFGKVPGKMCVLHKCDNRECTNPSHLFLGSNRDNVADKVKKNRQAKGSGNGRAKLSDREVLVIRSRYKPYCPVDGCNALARKFKVSSTVVWGIVNNTTWKHLLTV